jgi:formamidopyrimidine-DNA glycosylase
MPPEAAPTTLRPMPELPEAERARQTLESALGRRIVAVDDRDTYVCRPHAPGELASALTGHTLATAHRRGKFMWLETDDGPALGLHLGMAGRILVDPEDSTRWDRFTLEFADGGRLVLRDKRRLGRALLNPDFSHVGPDAAEVSRDDFRRLIGSGRTPIKARLLNQHAISGIGNLLADQILWQARISPLRSTAELSTDDLDRLRREVRAAVRSAIRKGGAHTGRFIQARRHEGVCPRDGHALSRSRVGGRTTYWCPACQT